jgi:hypothetical protein
MRAGQSVSAPGKLNKSQRRHILAFFPHGSGFVGTSPVGLNSKKPDPLGNGSGS